MAEEKRPKEKMADGKKSPKEKKAPFPLDALFFLLLNTHPSIPWTQRGFGGGGWKTLVVSGRH